MARAGRKAAGANAPIMRRHPLEGRQIRHDGVELKPAPPAQRLSVRAPTGSHAALTRALGLKLPVAPKSSSVLEREGAVTRAALWLGPDEWLVIEFGDADLVAACARIKRFHSAIDVSHRNTAIVVSGPAAEAVLNGGCPLDLSLASFPVGACTRTVMAKAEIVLWRRSQDEFRVECWRSYSEYVFGYLALAAKDASL